MFYYRNLNVENVINKLNLYIYIIIIIKTYSFIGFCSLYEVIKQQITIMYLFYLFHYNICDDP